MELHPKCGKTLGMPVMEGLSSGHGAVKKDIEYLKMILSSAVRMSRLTSKSNVRECLRLG